VVFQFWGGPRLIADPLGTVLIDCFDTPPRPACDTTEHAAQSVHLAPIPVSTPQTSPYPNTNKHLRLSVSQFSLSLLNAPTSGIITPQRSFDSHDKAPSTSTSSVSTSASEQSTSASSPESSELSNIEEGHEAEPIEVLGGGGMYALAGARIWLPPSECKALVDTDVERRDLSKELEDELEELGKGCWAYMEGEGRRMVRARIRYEGTARL
jgi:hypothetical protein